MTDARVLKKTLILPSGAWVAYDLANTVYAAILSYLFIPWVGETFGTRSVPGIIASVSMVAAGVCIPVFAAASDRTGRGRKYLIVSTMVCIGAMAAFGASSMLWLAMVLFFVANFAYQAGLVFYNALLPSVASDARQGLVSGLGVGVGYVGTILTLLIALPLAASHGEATAFVFAALLFLIFALPSFVLVKERRVVLRGRLTPALARSSLRSVMTTIRGLPQHRSVMWFLIGNFFCVDVLNTAILYFGDLTLSTFRPLFATHDWTLAGLRLTSEGGLLMIAGLALNGLALLFGVLLGVATDRVGSLKTLRFSALCLAVGLAGTSWFAGENPGWFMVAICGFGGLGLSGIWTAGRKLLIELSPREKLGEYFGLYGITTKVSVLGGMVFGLIKDGIVWAGGSEALSWKWAIGVQALPLLLGLLFLAFVRVGDARVAASPDGLTLHADTDD